MFTTIRDRRNASIELNHMVIMGLISFADWAIAERLLHYV